MIYINAINLMWI